MSHNITYYSMKTFRQKFIKIFFFPILVLFYVMLISFLIVYYYQDIENPAFVRILISIFALYVIINTFLCIQACNYLILTDSTIEICNPYFHLHRKFMLNRITHIKIFAGAWGADKFIRITTDDNNRYTKQLSLVSVFDLKKIVEIFNEHGIEVEKDIWKGYFK